MNNTLSHPDSAKPGDAQGTQINEDVADVFHLSKGKFHSCFLSAGEQVHLRILAGHVWATMEGDPDDYVLGRGDRLYVASQGHLLIEALSDAHFSVEQSSIPLAGNPS